jgi:hypothetical protein
MEVSAETGISLVRKHVADETFAAHEPRPSTSGLECRDRSPVDGDRDRLAGLDTVEQSARVVSQLSRSDIGHATTVAHVRQMSTLGLWPLKIR